MKTEENKRLWKAMWDLVKKNGVMFLWSKDIHVSHSVKSLERPNK